MAHEDQIAQILGAIPSLTEAQIASLVSFDPTSLNSAIQAAENVQGYEADRQIARVNRDYVSTEVWQLARFAILGILAGDSTLVTPWTSIVGDFAHEEVEAEAHLEVPASVETPVEPAVEVSAEDQAILPAQNVETSIAPFNTVIYTDSVIPATEVPDPVVPTGDGVAPATEATVSLSGGTVGDQPESVVTTTADPSAGAI